jgi:hypothetical protein
MQAVGQSSRQVYISPVSKAKPLIGASQILTWGTLLGDTMPQSQVRAPRDRLEACPDG